MAFVHLHNHSDFSILDGATPIPSMVKRAVDEEMPAVALTDHGYMFGIPNLDLECRKYNDIPTKYVAKISFQPYGMKMYDLRSEFEGTEYLDFEMLKVPVPSGYKIHLRRQYGDYHKLVIGTSDHGELILDPDTPYREWIRKYREDPEGMINEQWGET